MTIPAFSVKKKVTITMLTLIIVLVGVITFSRLGVDLLPDVDYPTISVVSTYSGASPADIEEIVTRPMEQWISTVQHVKKVQSISKEGICVINIEFEWGTNLDFAAQDVREVLGLYENQLPENVSKPVVVKFNLSQIPVLMYGVSGKRSLFEVEQIVKDKVVEHLQRIEGVASAYVFSPEVREFQVLLRRDRISALGVPPERVLQTLAAENINQPAGYLVQGHSEFILRTVGEFRSMDTIRKIPVGMTSQGKIIRLSEVAEIVDTKKETRMLARSNGEPALFFIVAKSSGANTVIVAAKVKAAVEELQNNLPQDIKLNLGMDMSRDIKRIASGTTANVVVGGLLVIIVVFLFLSNWRPTLTISISIPLSIIATFISFYVAGYTLNLITLMGLGLGVGMLVDNSVVVIENVFRHFVEEGKDIDTAAIAGTEEVGMAIAASTFTTIGVFFPMLFATGMVGKFAQALTLSVCFALLSSLYVALSIIPMLTSVIFRGMSREYIRSKAAHEKGFDRYRNFYKKLLISAMKNRKKFLFVVLGLFIISLALIPFLGTEFMAHTDRSTALLKVRLPVGTPMEITDKITREIETVMKTRKEILSYASIVGVNEQDQGGGNTDTNPKGTHEAIFWMTLQDKQKRDFSTEQVISQVKSKVAPYKGMKLETVDFGAAFFGGSTYPVQVNLFGKDLVLLEKLSEVVAENMKRVRGFTDINSSFTRGKDELHILVDREKAYRLGLNVNAVASAIHTYTIGKVFTRYKEKGEEYDIRVLLDKRDRKTMNDMMNLPILTPLGKKVFLQDVAKIEIGIGPLEIERENQIRKVSVFANISGRDLGSTIAELKTTLSQFERNLPSGYFIEYAGQYEDMKDAFTDLFYALLIAGLLTYMIMAAQFEHLLHPFVIMFTIPMAYMGVSFALFIAGKPINVVVFMGIIILAGIAVNNGIVMIDYINRLRSRGVEGFQAIIQGAVTRMRPVLITSITTIFGMVPMIFTTSEGAEMRVPLGLTIVGGLTAATFLTLFVIPLLYALFNRIKYQDASASGGA